MEIPNEDVNRESLSTTPESAIEPGSKTDPELLLKSLQEEREQVKRERESRLALEKELAERNAEIEAARVAAAHVERSEEGLMLQKEIDALHEKLALKDLTDQFPQLKDKTAEFQDFKAQYPGVETEKVAKLFMAETGLLETTPRKGLEKAGGGTRQPVQQGMSSDDIAELRKNNYRKYAQMLKDGKIKL